ncbi:MAG: glycosyltransferase family 2 protein [Candidatus Moranbacteria bacterium]|nr:glycosyltransferase family 2 protein [Candidatus Moranbacteria bacterium]
MNSLFSFIVINFKSAHLLSDWFASLSKTGLSSNEYEIIIVNNDLSEAEKLDTLNQQHQFKLIHAKSNIGFGAACNLGATVATGEILGFINPDTEFLSGDLHLLYDRFLNNSSLGIIGLKLLTQQGLVQEWSVGTRITLWDIINNNLGFPKSKLLWESQKPIGVDWVSGASLFIPKTLFQEVNGFDEDFFLYFEDTDLCERVRLEGKSILYFPPISLQHLCGHSAPSHKQQKEYFYTSQDIYFAKHRPKWEGWCVKILRRIFFL